MDPTPLRITVQVRHAERFGVGSHADGEIHYAFYGNGAFMGRTTVDPKTKRALLSRLFDLVDKLEDGWDEKLIDDLKQIGRQFYTLLLPAEVQRAFSAEESATIELDVQDHDIPWELLHDGGDFIARRLAMGRRVIGPESPRTARRSVRVLIVADPLEDLRGARQEGEVIGGRCREALDDLTDAYELGTEVIGLNGREATKDTVLLDLLMDSDSPIDIFHFAGHAYSDPHNPDRSGIVLADGNLRAFEARSLGGEPLVFANGCRAGQTLDSAITFGEISGFAAEFLAGGAIGYIAPAWPVSDEVARRFADKFYGFVISGQTIEFAVLNARQAIDDPDALAYVYYGRVGERLAIFSPQLTAGPFVNELGVQRIIELEREYPALELLAVNELPWMLWDAEDILEWTSRIPIDQLRQGAVAKNLLEYAQEFGGLIREGNRRLLCVLNAKTIRAYIARRGVDRWKSLANDLETYLVLPGFTLILASSQNSEIEEIELVSKSAAIPPSATDSVYVFNKQTRFEQRRITYNLFEDYNPQMITYYWAQMESLIAQSLSSYRQVELGDVYSGAASAQLNAESFAKLEGIALEELDLQL